MKAAKKNVPAPISAARALANFRRAAQQGWLSAWYWQGAYIEAARREGRAV